MTLTAHQTSHGDDSRDSAARAFCPVGGIFGKTTADFAHQSRDLLGTRLRLAGAILLGGFLAFFARYPFLPAPLPTEMVVAHISVIVVLAGAIAVLFYRGNRFSMTALRWFEVPVFGVPAAFFVWMHFCQVCHCPPEMRVANAYAFPAETVIPWLILIEVYGFFIPNTYKRTAIVILAMALAPLAGAWAVAARYTEVYDVLMDGRLSAMILWMAIGAVIAIYGSHRLGTLRRAAFEAKRFGVYNLRERLGSGGMGDVYVAEHQLLKRRCAIKLIKPEKAGDENAIARFESEVQAAARLTHPNTIEIYDYGVTRDGTFYYVMEYLPGLNLQEMTERFGPLPPERVIHLLKQVCSALREAHAAGMIHRDIKPGNIFAAERGGVFDIAKLLDFGLVKSINPDPESVKVTHIGTVVGSPLFAAPEAAVDGEPNEQSDIYSIGATAYYLLTGRPVFPGENPLKVLFAHAQEEPDPLSQHLPDVPGDLETVIMKCLAKKPGDRFQTVKQVKDALEDCRVDMPWTQTRAREWWSTAPIETDAEVPDQASAETAITAVMQLPG